MKRLISLILMLTMIASTGLLCLTGCPGPDPAGGGDQTLTIWWPGGSTTTEAAIKAAKDGDTVTIESLKSKNIVTKKADKIKVLARGVMTKRLTVVADKFSIQAVKMIGLAGGRAQKYKD